MYKRQAVYVQQTYFCFSGAGISAAFGRRRGDFCIICDFVYDDKQYAYETESSADKILIKKIDEKIILIIWIPHPEQKPVYQISDSRSHCRVY